MNDIMTYMGYLWAELDGDILSVGINEDGLDELGENPQLKLPEDGDEVEPGQVCGEIETDSGPLNLYSPVVGVVVEVNESLLEDPSPIFDDPMGDGWLFKVEAENPENIDMVTLQTGESEDPPEGLEEEDEEA